MNFVNGGVGLRICTWSMPTIAAASACSVREWWSRLRFCTSSMPTIAASACSVRRVGWGVCLAMKGNGRCIVVAGVRLVSVSLGRFRERGYLREEGKPSQAQTPSLTDRTHSMLAAPHLRKAETDGSSAETRTREKRTLVVGSPHEGSIAESQLAVAGSLKEANNMNQTMNTEETLQMVRGHRAALGVGYVVPYLLGHETAHADSVRLAGARRSSGACWVQLWSR